MRQRSHKWNAKTAGERAYVRAGLWRSGRETSLGENLFRWSENNKLPDDSRSLLIRRDGNAREFETRRDVDIAKIDNVLTVRWKANPLRWFFNYNINYGRNSRKWIKLCDALKIWEEKLEKIRDQNCIKIKHAFLYNIKELLVISILHIESNNIHSNTINFFIWRIRLIKLSRLLSLLLFFLSETASQMAKSNWWTWQSDVLRSLIAKVTKRRGAREERRKERGRMRNIIKETVAGGCFSQAWSRRDDNTRTHRHLDATIVKLGQVKTRSVWDLLLGGRTGAGYRIGIIVLDRAVGLSLARDASRTRVLRGGPGDDIGSLIGQIPEKNALLRLLSLPHSISPLLFARSLASNLSPFPSRLPRCVTVSLPVSWKRRPVAYYRSPRRSREEKPGNYWVERDTWQRCFDFIRDQPLIRRLRITRIHKILRP